MDQGAPIHNSTPTAWNYGEQGLKGQTARQPDNLIA